MHTGVLYTGKESLHTRRILETLCRRRPTEWDTYIPYAMFTYNSSKHESTGKQPYALLYGKTLQVPTTLAKPPEPQYNDEDY